MKKYERPVVMVNEELAEGVYAASGDGCYDVWITGHQVPEGTRSTHKFQFDGKHLADLSDGHSGSAQVLIVKFDKVVKYISSNGTLVSGDGTDTLQVSYTYTQNPGDNIGLGDLEVQVVLDANEDLAVVGLALTCNRIKNW